MVIRGCPEEDSEHVVHVRGIKMQPLGTCSFMLKFISPNIEVRDLLNRLDTEAREDIVDFDVVWDPILATWDILTDLMGFAPGCHYLCRSSLLLLHFCDTTFRDICECQWVKGSCGLAEVFEGVLENATSRSVC